MSLISSLGSGLRDAITGAGTAHKLADQARAAISELKPETQILTGMTRAHFYGLEQLRNVRSVTAGDGDLFAKLFNGRVPKQGELQVLVETCRAMPEKVRSLADGGFAIIA